MRRVGDVILRWGTDPRAYSFDLYRGTVKDSWPAPALRERLVLAASTEPDVAWPPTLYFYRAAGVSCTGEEGP